MGRRMKPDAGERASPTNVSNIMIAPRDAQWSLTVSIAHRPLSPTFEDAVETPEEGVASSRMQTRRSRAQRAGLIVSALMELNTVAMAMVSAN